jgi:hypothetical protein
MSMRISSLLVLNMVVISCGLVGCSSGDDTDQYTLVPVSGTVTHNGKPLEGANLTFTPDPSNPEQTPGGDVTGPTGNYKAMYRGRSGLAAGKYRVLVSKTILPPGMKPSAEGEDDYMNQIASESAAGAGGRGAAAVTEIEESVDREVASGGGVIDIDVKALPKPATNPQ